MWRHHEFERLHHLSEATGNCLSKKITEKQNIFIKRCSCPTFPRENDDASPKEVGLWRERNTLWAKALSFPIVLHEKDGSGGNCTSLNYNLEGSKHLAPGMCNQLEMVWKNNNKTTTSLCSTCLSWIPGSRATFSISRVMCSFINLHAGFKNLKSLQWLPKI